MGVRLPAEYQEVTCIIGQGTQYIDTGYVLTSGCRVQGKYNLYGDKTKLGSVMALFGARDSNYNNAFAMFNVTGAPRIDYGKTLTTHSFYYTAINNRNVADFDLNAGIATVNGRTYAFDDSLKPFTCPSTALIFAAHTENTVDTRHPRGEIVYLKITDENGTVVRDMIPCYRKSDNKPGMYDLVSETFFVNQGTGEFLVGPDVVNHISPRLMDRRRALIAKLTSLFRKVIMSQTGLVSFDTNVVKPMKVTCEFSPKQDLHGYDHPWPAGGGKNLWDGTFNEYIPSQFTSGTQLCLQAVLDDMSKYIVLRTYDSNKTFLQSVATINISGNINFGLLTLTSDAAFIRIEKSNDITATNVMLSIASTVQTYQPYSNICPIEGWDGANVAHSGKSITQFVKNEITPTVNYNGFIGWHNGWRVPGRTGKYTYSVYIDNRNAQSDSTATVWFLGANNTTYVDGTAKAGNSIPSGSEGFSTVTIDMSTLPNTYYLYFGLGLRANGTARNPIVVAGEIASDYEPYHGTTLSIAFNNPGTYEFLPIQEGTGDPSPENVRPITPGLTLTRDDSTTLEVYGGSMTVNADGTGSLVSSKGDIHLNGASSENWQLAGNSTVFAYKVSGMENTRIPPLCNRFVLQNPYGNAYNVRVNISDTSVTTVSDFKAWLANNELHVVYPLETPITYTLSVAETSRAFQALGLGKNLGPLYGGSVTVNEDGSVDVMADNGIGNFDPTKITAIDTNVGVRTGVRTARSNASFGEEFSYNGHIASDYIFDSLVSRDSYTQGLGIRIMNYTVYLTMLNEILDSSLSDADYIAAAIEYFTEHPVTGVLPLATPQTYHFSSISELQSFLGTNNVWSDLNGPITVEYYKKQQ